VAYTFYVRCMDGNGNANTDDLAIAFDVAVPGPDLPPPVALWQLDEGGGTAAADTAGGNAGTVQGDAVWGPGQAGSALVFDGTNDYVSIPDHPSLDYSGYAGLTLALWVRPDRLNHTDEQTVFGHWSGRKGSRALQLLLGQDNRWQCETNDGDGVATSASVAALGTWSHVACRWTPAGLEIYVNGVLEAADPVVESSLDTNSGLHTIGVREKSGAVDQFFRGAVDEVYLYGRGLSAGEIGSVMSGGL
jgi:hypothetical protein